MVESNITFTPNLHLSKLPANYHVWAQIMNNNLTVLDGAVSGFIVYDNWRGAWTNSTAYAAGDTVVDLDTAVIWAATTSHTSSQIPTTFTQEQLLHPTYWVPANAPARARGAWTGPGTAYNVNDFVLANGTKYAMCLVQHVSGPVFDDDAVAGKWSVLFDISSSGGSASISPTPPLAPAPNQLWWSTELGQLFIYYNDGNSAQWVPASPTGNVGGGPINAGIYGNNGAAIIAAVAAARAGGSRTVYIPDGVWEFTERLILPDDYPIALVGQSRAGTILRAMHLDTQRFISFSATTAENATGGQICNMTIDCNHFAYEGIRLWRAREWLLDNLLIVRVLNASVGTESDPDTNAGKGIVLGGGSNTLACRISNTSILYEEADYPDPATCPAIGIYMNPLHASDNFVTDMLIKNAKYACIYDNGNGGNSYSNIHPYGYPVGESGLLDYRPQYGIYANQGFVVIENCYFDTMATAGIYLRFQDNIVASTRHTSSKPVNTCSAIKFADAIQRTLVVGCVSTNMGGGRYTFDGTIGTSVRLTGNDTGDPLRTTTVANAVNWIDIVAGATGNDATIRTFGDSTTGITYQTAGAGTHKFQYSTTSSVEVYGVASMVNRLRLRGSVAGSPVVVSCDGDDTSIDVQLTPKGAGLARFGTYTATPGTITGYISIKDSAGTTRRIAVTT